MLVSVTDGRNKVSLHYLCDMFLFILYHFIIIIVYLVVIPLTL